MLEEGTQDDLGLRRVTAAEGRARRPVTAAEGRARRPATAVEGRARRLGTGAEGLGPPTVADTETDRDLTTAATGRAPLAPAATLATRDPYDQMPEDC